MRRTCILGLALAVLLIVAATSVNAGKCDLQGYLSDDGKLKLEICTTPQGYVMIRRTWVPTGAFTEVQFDADPDQNGLVHEQRVTTLGWHEQYAHGHPFSDLDPIEVESGSYGQHVLGWITGCDDDDMTYQQCRDCLGRQATGMIVIGAFGGSTEELDLWSEVADNHMASGIRRCLGLPGAPYTPICSNGNDDDNDTWTDYPLDTDCADPNDTSEESFQIYQCSDGEDNDDDTRTDAADWQCIASDDDDEEN